MKTILGIIVILATTLTVIESKCQTISYPAGINVPFVFDDFHYPVEVDSNYSTGVWPGSWRGSSDYSIFGRNKWFEGDGVGTLEIDSLKRGWYIGNWAEHGNWGTLYSGNGHNSNDRSWFDAAGYRASTLIAPLSSKIDDLDNNLSYTENGITYPYTPQFLVLRANPGAYGLLTGFFQPTFGHTARFGTWVVHMMIPAALDSIPSNGNMKTAFWIWSPEQAYYDADPVRVFGAPYVWSEVNWEWFDYADAENGITWANYWSDLGGQPTHKAANPIFGEYGAVGRCYHVDDNGTPSQLNSPDCIRKASGDEAYSEEDKFITIVIRSKPSSIETYLVAWDFDLALNRPTSSANDFYDGFDILYMKNTEAITNYVSPMHMQPRIDFVLNGANETTPLNLSAAKEVVVDWFFYSSDTDFSIWYIPAWIQNIRKKLAAYNYQKNPTSQVWRINSTGRSVQGPFTYEPDWNDGVHGSCDRNDGGNGLKWGNEEGPFVSDYNVVLYETGSVKYVGVETLVDEDHDIRLEKYHIEWSIFDATDMSLFSAISDSGTAIRWDSSWPTNVVIKTDVDRWWDANEECGSTAVDPQPDEKWSYLSGSTLSQLVGPSEIEPSLSGPSVLGWGAHGTLNANLNWGPVGVEFEWSYRPGGSGPWNSLSETGTSHNMTMVWTEGVEYRVRTTIDGATIEDSHFITFSGGSGGAKTESVVHETKLNDLYPNPYGVSTALSFSIKESGVVLLQVFDVQGKLVQTIKDGWVGEGNHVIDLDLDLASGVYLARLEVNDMVFVKQFIKVH